MSIVYLGIDLAKSVFALCGVDESGRAALVRPGIARGKNNATGAAAIYEVLQRPNMRFVPIKSTAQQATLCLHRVRRGFIEQRTACINRIRGLLSEFGIVLPLKAPTARREALQHRSLCGAGPIRRWAAP